MPPAPLAAGFAHTCMVDRQGQVRCWGNGDSGRLGAGDTESVGDDESAGCARPVDLGGEVVHVALGRAHTCAVVDTDDAGAVYCWGANEHGQLGHGHTEDIGDDELPAAAGPVDVGGEVVRLAAGATHTCALLRTGAVRCWGDGTFGQLGHGNVATIGDDETPAAAGHVSVGGVAVQIAAGSRFTCALLQGGSVRCWGDGSHGKLGRGDTDTIGDDELPAQVAPVDLGGEATAIAAGGRVACALLEGGEVRCWGEAASGQLGQGARMGGDIGDDETPAQVAPINLGGRATSVHVGGSHACATLAADTDLGAGAVRCWGDGAGGALGHGRRDMVGDDEAPASAPLVDVGSPVTGLAAGGRHTCAVLDTGDTGAVRCWGDGEWGQHGHGSTDSIGAFESPAVVGDVPLGQCTQYTECRSIATCAGDAVLGNHASDRAFLLELDTRPSDGYYGLELPGLAFCAGEEDWYELPVDALAEQLDSERVSLHIGVYHSKGDRDCDLCASGGRPSCPENVVRLEVRDAHTGVVLAQEVSTRGFARLQERDWPTKDLLLRIYGAPEVALPYTLEVGVGHEPCTDPGCAPPALCTSC